MADTPNRVDAATGTGFVGHEWDGIEELDTPMPRWWLYILYATIAFSVVYTILYPAWPLASRATDGTLGWTSHGQLAQELAAEQKRKGPVLAAIAATPAEALLARPDLVRAAQEGGRAAFKVNCVQCHGSGAAGSKGYPNLNDDDWLWGGDVATIEQTIAHGIRQPGDDATRVSQMPAFGRDGLLTAAQIQDVVSYVRFVSRQEPMSKGAQQGQALFAANCAVCHGDQARGNRELGAPNLTDAIWLYGGDRAALTQTITNARGGIMPAWHARLSPATIRMLAIYVHSLGGGEKAPAPPPQTAQQAGGDGQPQ
ncbi:cytochrome-c oxidase, cbb3-type subunit III [Sphingomonas sp.]|uniref:cytochrome-c oxidase, cbb3-type subunit III n=1 Tax=Sphingomonas sp. TaxID=28214 RepID=UPI001D4CD5E3|nr:cytochrome-c oxidase, cbb3-type subunit III [Sphingomonas sp.]MBX9796702.1 cytochrome-c oxidase, cbb3-type subunit III [Sphingomonas sp.]